MLANTRISVEVNLLRPLTILPVSRWQRVVRHLEATKEARCQLDHSSYAQGRSKYWLQWEWSLKERRFVPGVKDNYLWNFCKEFFPEADLGLVCTGSVGIRPHRDDSYADWRAVGLNLGELESWYYDCQYPEFRWTPHQRPSNPQHYKLSAGTVFEFNCKNLHGAVNPAKNRWGVFLWKVSPKLRQQFLSDTK